MPSDEIIETMARAIYNGRNGPGCTSWGRLPGRHKAPYLGDARAALSAAEAAGWVMVPKEPTLTMRRAGAEERDRPDSGAAVSSIYGAMIEARP